MPTRWQTRGLHWRIALLPILAVTLLAGCWNMGERLGGPTVAVHNDAGRSIVVRVFHQKYAIAPGETSRLWGLRFTNSGDPSVVEVLDAASCQVFTTITLPFTTGLDPLVTVPASGPPTASMPSDTARAAFGKASESPNLCEGPTDGWVIVVDNGSSTTYYLAAATESGQTADYGVTVPPDSSGTYRLFDFSPPGGYSVVAGTFILYDTGCRVLDRVDHPAWGTYNVTIMGDQMTLAPGPIPADSSGLRGIDYAACPAARPGFASPTPSEPPGT